MRIETPRIWLPRTGQTATSPTENYAEGDDGWFQTGNPRKTRFVDNGNGTIRDRATGLQWVKDPSDCGEVFYADEALVAMFWPDAVAACLGLDYAGYADWRLPNIVELLSIVNWGTGGAWSPLVDIGQLFWSSTSLPAPNSAYAKRFQFGSNGNTSHTLKASATVTYVRPVRGGRINANW